MGSLLGAAVYDPGTAQTNTPGGSLSAMTAVDTTNLRATFTAPASGKVLVRLKGSQDGGSGGGVDAVLFGVLEGATVIGRQAPIGGRTAAASTMQSPQIAEFAVTGVSAGSHSYDFAVAVQQAGASAGVIAYGGPNDTTTNNAFGAASIEVWDATNLLAAANYDPGAQVSKATSSLLAMTALDTTNLRCTFTAPASGRVLCVLRGNWVAPGTSITCQTLLGVLESSTVVARGAPVGGQPGGGTIAANGYQTFELSQVVTGISAGSHTYDAAYGVEVVLASSNYKYGGPNDANGADAAGMFRFEVWGA